MKTLIETNVTYYPVVVTVAPRERTLDEALHLSQCHYYRLQRSWGKVMFSQASVILLTAGCLPQCMLGYTPPGNRHPLGADTPPGADTPLEQTPPQE